MKLTPELMVEALHKYRLLETPSQVAQSLEMIFSSYLQDLAILMKKGSKCYYETWENAKKLYSK